MEDRINGERLSHLHWTEEEKDKLLVTVAANLARERKARGLKLNVPETISILTSEVMERARDGMTVAELMRYGGTILTKNDCMEGISDMIPEVQVEATFPDGTKLVTIHEPIR